MTLDATVPPSPGPVHPDLPGHCAEHPELELTTARLAGMAWYHWRTTRIYCPSREHDPYTAARCRYCGGPLVPAGVRSWSGKREYCSALHRNYGWRVERRRERDRARARAAS